MLHDMLMRPDMLIRQQQQQQHTVQGLASRELFMDTGEYAFSRYMHNVAALQHSKMPDSLLGGPGASRLSRECDSSACDSEQQHSGLQQLDRRWSTVSGLSEDVAAPGPKCRLSFGSIRDEPSGMQEQPSRPNSVEVGQEIAGAAAAAGDDQQPGLRRPSPMTCSTQQQQNSSKSSMRPPLHRTGSAQAVAVPNTTPVLLRPSSAGAVVQGHSGSTAAGQKRKVSDLATALTTAANALNGMAAGTDVLDGLLAGCHAQHDVSAPDHLLQGHVVVNGTPAAMQRGSSNAIPGLTTQEVDTVCPMSLGPSTQKRSRAVFEAAGAAVVHDEHEAAQAADEHQQEQQNAMPMSVNRKYLRGRRSSIGCCNMETDVDEQPQQQHSVVGSMLPPANHSTNPDHSTTKHSMQSRAAHYDSDSTHHAQADSKQQHLEALLSDHNISLEVPHNSRTAQGALQLLQPWQQLPAGSRNSLIPARRVGVDFSMAPPAAETVSDAADVDRPIGDRQRHSTCAADSKGSIPALSTGGNTADSAAGGDSVGPCTSHRLGCLIGGLQDALPAVHTVDNTPGNLDEELAKMDHHQLAEWASQWKPVVQSAEKRYLVERKLQMDEALLQVGKPPAVAVASACELLYIWPCL